MRKTWFAAVKVNLPMPLSTELGVEFPINGSAGLPIRATFEGYEEGTNRAIILERSHSLLTLVPWHSSVNPYILNPQILQCFANKIQSRRPE